MQLMHIINALPSFVRLLEKLFQIITKYYYKISIPKNRLLGQTDGVAGSWNQSKNEKMRNYFKNTTQNVELKSVI